MYHLSDQQIDYILNDIRARGVEMESLQQDLLDHICCIVENKLEASGDFEHFYMTTIKTFYKKELREIEEETITLLNNKNYYAMKKIMIGSGIISAILLTMGIVLKFLHMPGAAMGIVTGIVLFSLVFLPLMFTLRLKEKEKSKDKILLGLGSVVTILISMATMFKIMHWPGANMMGITSVGILILLYLPINLITGIKNPDTKVNTIVTSILLVAGCGLFLSLARSPQGSKYQYIKNTEYYLRNDRIYKNELAQLKNTDSNSKQADQIITLCDEIKSYIIEKETGLKTLDNDFETKQAWLGETFSEVYFQEDSKGFRDVQKLKQLVKEYNTSKQSNPIPDIQILSDKNNERIVDVLNNLVQLEMLVIQNEIAAD
ncbi:MAG TPA: hypothetical protein PKD91_00245 [Bacteroidia bacterium]|nr:hypothetical protein [Bacteroidia bacterium]